MPPAVARPLYGLLLLSLVGRVVFTMWEPPFDGSVRYDDIAPLPAYWPMNLYLGGPSYAVSFVATAILVVLLARGRTAVLTLAGAALIGLGGLLFSLAITAEALPFALAADRALFPEEQGRALFDVLNAHLDRVVPAIVGGSLAVVLGALLTFAAGWSSGTLPRWFAGAGVAYLVGYLALPADLLPRAGVVVLYLLEVALLAGLGWFGVRAAGRTPTGGPVTASPSRS